MYLEEIKKLGYHDYDELKYYLIEGVNTSTKENIKKVDADVSPKALITGLLKSMGYQTNQTFQGMSVYKGITKHSNEHELETSQAIMYFRVTLIDKMTGNLTNHVSFYTYR